jgi:RNA polymerase sigma-70 factor (ECF subfamily)
VIHAQAGNQEAFETLYRYHAAALSRYLLGLVNDQEAGEELVQETFVKVWRYLPSLKDVSVFRPWLYSIARNVARDYIRSRKRLAIEVDLSDEGSDIVNPMRFEQRVEERELVWHVLQCLPWKERESLLLQLNGFPTSEIAEVLNVSSKSVATYISRARKTFREAYNRLKADQTRGVEEKVFYNDN